MNISDYEFNLSEYESIKKETTLITGSLSEYTDGSNFDSIIKHECFCFILKKNLNKSFNNFKIVIKTKQVYVFVIWCIFAPYCYYNLAGLWGSRYLQEVMNVKKKSR